MQDLSAASPAAPAEHEGFAGAFEKHAERLHHTIREIEEALRADSATRTTEQTAALTSKLEDLRGELRWLSHKTPSAMAPWAAALAKRHENLEGERHDLQWDLQRKVEALDAAVAAFAPLRARAGACDASAVALRNELDGWRQAFLEGALGTAPPGLPEASPSAVQLVDDAVRDALARAAGTVAGSLAPTEG